MALRNQPYLPLYVNDFSNDLNVKRCSSSSIGVYIMLMCVLHQGHEYGTLILRKNEKKSPDQVKNFSALLIKLMPFDIIEIEAALNELLENQVLKLDGDKLIQKRMVKDGIISDKRSKAGKKGGERTRDKARFAQAKAGQKPGPDKPVDAEDEPIDANLEEKKDQLIKNIVDKFNYGSHQNKKQQSMIMAFVNSLPFHGKLDFLITEFESYKELKELDKDKYLHTIENFIGTQSKQYADGAWDDNWTEKLRKHKTKNNGSNTKSGAEGIRSNVNPPPKRSFRKQL